MTSLTYIAAGTPGPAAPPLWRILTEIGYFGALALAGGVFLALAFLLPADARSGEVAAQLRALLVPVAGFTVIAGYLQTASGVARSKLGYSFGEALSPGHLAEYARMTPEKGRWLSTGASGVIQLIGFVVVAVLLVVVSRAGDRFAAPSAAGFGLVVLTAAVPTIGTAFTSLDTGASALLKLTHILAAVIWLGGLFVLALAGFRARRSGVDGAGAWERMWTRFSFWALGAVIGVTVSGLWMAWVHLGAFDEFVTTSYGRFLLVKLVLVVGMVAAGAYNVRVLIPALHRARLTGDEATYSRLALRHFPKVVAGESIAALGVLSIVPFLAGSARKQAGQAAASPFDTTTLELGVVLVALLVIGAVAAVKAGERVARAGLDLTPEPVSA